MFHNTTKVWEGIKNVKILTVNDLDHQVALAYACQGIREIDSDIAIEIIDCTCKAVVPPIVENPVDDTMILFLGSVITCANLAVNLYFAKTFVNNSTLQNIEF
jgi:hypothetical protein